VSFFLCGVIDQAGIPGVVACVFSASVLASVQGATMGAEWAYTKKMPAASIGCAIAGPSQQGISTGFDWMMPPLKDAVAVPASTRFKTTTPGRLADHAHQGPAKEPDASACHADAGRLAIKQFRPPGISRYPQRLRVSTVATG